MGIRFDRTSQKSSGEIREVYKFEIEAAYSGYLASKVNGIPQRA